MASYPPDALGKVVRGLREQKHWTQEKLGRDAGYKASGAAVSISRLENGLLNPTPEKFEGIANALGLSAEALAQKAAAEASKTLESGEPNVSESIDDRAARVESEIEDRKELVRDLGEAFTEAAHLAQEGFLMRLIELAGGIRGAQPPDSAHLDVAGSPLGDEVRDEVAYGILFRRLGVQQALTGTSGRMAVGPERYSAFAAAVAGATAAAAAGLPDLTDPAARNGFLAALQVGAPAMRGKSGARHTALLTGLVVGLVGVAHLTQRNRKKRELALKVEAAEAQLAENQPNVEALRDLMPRATEILEYVGVHAGHALDRWAVQTGQGPRDWESLSAAERERYNEFVEIAAAQLAVAGIDFENLMSVRGDELQRAVALVEETLTQSRSLITSHV